MTVITFGLAWLLAGRMLRPLHAITSTARRLSESTLHERIALKGPRDELKELADTFDGMLGRLDTAFTAQKEFVANASHELRTPLTIIRTEIDVALGDPELSQDELREMGAAVTEAVDRSEKLIDGLLVLASAESSPTLVDLDLAEIAEERGRPAPQRGRRPGTASGARPAARPGRRASGLSSSAWSAIWWRTPSATTARRLVLGQDLVGGRPGRARGGQRRTRGAPRGARAPVRPLLPPRQVAQPQDRRVRAGSLHRQVGRCRPRRHGGSGGARGRRPGVTVSSGGQTRPEGPGSGS